MASNESPSKRTRLDPSQAAQKAREEGSKEEVFLVTMETDGEHDTQLFVFTPETKEEEEFLHNAPRHFICGMSTVWPKELEHYMDEHSEGDQYTPSQQQSYDHLLTVLAYDEHEIERINGDMVDNRHRFYKHDIAFDVDKWRFLFKSSTTQDKKEIAKKLESCNGIHVITFVQD